jgi:hypothetical protein
LMVQGTTVNFAAKKLGLDNNNYTNLP